MQLKKEPLLELRKISKRFPGVNALKGVDFSIDGGEIVSLVGTNGAGKSTLSSIIAGIYTPDEGEILIEGKAVKILNPNIAEELGIGIVHQEPTLVPNMSVAANLFLNRERTKKGIFLDYDEMKKESEKILQFLGFTIDTEELVGNLTLVEKEIVEIAKAMLTSPRILILDEVTAPLNKEEVEHLFKIIRDLKNKGLAIIFIGHRIKEIIDISDRIVVLRDGANAGELSKSEVNRIGDISEKEVIRMMLGEIGDADIQDYCPDNKRYIKDEVLLKVKNLSRKGSFKDINIELHSGEIVGLAGLKGSGITEFLNSLYGMLKTDSGEIYVKGSCVKIDNPAQAIAKGIGFITNDRQKEGLALIRDVKENITISSLEYLSGKLKMLKTATLKMRSKEYVKALEIKTPFLEQEVQYLSGGNQQKIVIAKWLLRGLDILLIDEPTRGVDVKAKSEIYKLLINQKKQGKGIIVSSPEIRELLNICDRILIVVSGSIVCEINRFDAACAFAKASSLLSAS
jgi:ribose transport system ATP-binding protein